MTLRPGRMKAAGVLLVSLAFVAIGILMAREEGHGALVICFTGFFALCAEVAAIQLHPKAAYLRLTPGGFTFCSLFRARSVPWTHVREFAVIGAPDHGMVAWSLTPDHPRKESAKAASGYEAALPDTYGMRAQDLADLLEALRREHGR